ncbi:MAG: hypothetical protein PHR83_02830 [Paludibacter sp.]|nr:hypothetical protein [Paludibacter sp.]
MKINRKKLVKVIGILAIAGILIGGGTAYYMFNMPHRNVQSTNADYSISASKLVSEYLENPNSANEKYLADDGDSKVLAISGTVSKIDKDLNGQAVVILKSAADKAGVSCTFTKETNQSASSLKDGETVTIKGVIRSGASYDKDLEMYENVVVEKSDIVKNK